MSRVLFLCFIPKIPLDESEELSIIELVESYGRLTKVLPIARSFPFKALLEVADSKSRTLILKHLSFLNHPLGQLKVFSSKKKEINNFTVSPLKYSLSQSSPLSTTHQHNSGEIPGHQDDSWYNPGKDTPFENSPEEDSGIQRSTNTSGNNLDQSFHPGVNLIPPMSRSINSNSSVTKSNWIQIHYNLPSKFVLKALSNLLGCFGNLKQLRFLQTSFSLFAEFETPSQARVTAATLDNIQLFDSLLRIFQVNPMDITLGLTNFETYIEDPRKHRFTDHLNIRMNPLSNNLHFTNLPRELDPVIFYSLVSQVNEPMIITRSTSKNVPESFMYLVQFHTSSQAAEVLSVLHNKVIQGKSIKVSFSHYHRNGISRKAP